VIARLKERLRGDDRGSVAVGTSVVLPAFFLLGLLIIAVGRMAVAEGAVQSAANEAARAASISRDAGAAQSTASTAATTTLANSDLDCVSTDVNTSTSGFATAVGQAATVQVTVTCVVQLADLTLPGAPATRTLTATATSVLDTYRERS
jgi:Flp pilus assembly protein TadG